MLLALTLRVESPHPRRREPESTATFVPQPIHVDIGDSFTRKLRAAQALRTVNRSTAMRLKQSLEAAGRRLMPHTLYLLR